MTKNKTAPLAFLIGAIIGAIVFIQFFGLTTVDPTNTNWIYSNMGDVTQHHLGWVYFRNTPWTFPIGLTDGISSGSMVSCMYTDSLPLFAIFFKLLSPVLPETFQYFGLWGVVCFALNGGFGALLLRRINSSLLFTSVGSIFYSGFFPSIQRIPQHNTLAAIWLIMAAMILALDYNRQYKNRFTSVVLWTLVCMLAALVHMYFLPMIYLVMLGYIILLVFIEKKKKLAAITFGSSTFFTVLTMWCIGAFYGNGSYVDGGFGMYSANLNTFFNSMGHSKYLRQLSTTRDQGEGYGYLGLGMLVCCFLGIIIAISRMERKEGKTTKNISDYCKKHKVRIRAFLLVFLLSFMWAVSTTVALNHNVLIDIKLPRLILGVFSIFRASGRFIWLPCLMVMTTALWLVSKLDKRSAAAAVSICAWLNYMDLRNYHDEMHKQYAEATAFVSEIDQDEWQKASNGITEIIFLPLPDSYKTYMQLYFNTAQLASEKGIRLSSFYLARTDYGTLAAYAQEQYDLLTSGKGRDNALYVFFTDEDIPEDTSGLTLYKLGEYTAARVKK